ncbi:putative acyl-activating enzyme 6 [Senna tora]|uniref:Putative acyl-activating enzyme 6 n=1 Tax=Senna tora TaxID=362788 RepID=A0A834U2H9_9FABA|nr:putative acyl-activating enzyme 6 [Senna tora]
MDQLKPNPANSTPLTPLTLLERAAIIYNDSPSIVYNGSIHSTWSQTHRRCLRLASSISSLGIRRRHVVSALAPNIPAMYELHFAVPFAGAVLSNLNIRLDPRTVAALLRHSDSRLVFVDQQHKSLLLDALSFFPPDLAPPLVVLISDDDDGIDIVDSSSTVFVDTYEGLIRRGDPGFEWVRPESEWDPIVLNYTSGTTSSPKGVVHSHRGAFVVTLDSLVDWSVPKQPVYLWTLPMFHSNGWSFPWGMAAVGGINICLSRFDAPTIYRLIATHGVTHMCAAPVVLNMLSNSKSKTEPMRNPVHLLTGGSPPPAAVLSRAESLGFLVSHGYGLTEALGVIISCAWKPRWNRFPATERARLKARQGVRTLSATEADVVDLESGRSVRPDGSQIGEIVLRGACVMMGYLKDPGATSESINPNGWFYTGDLGVMHEDGYIEIKDRRKDVIISGGENVSSVEVEAVLYTHEAVNEAAVVARPDEFWGETACAFVSLKKNGAEKKPTEKEIMEYCREKMAKFMVPKTVVFREELPKTETGKIVKHLLRKEAQAMGSLTVTVTVAGSRM